jgi:hypothetical protein
MKKRKRGQEMEKRIRKGKEDKKRKRGQEKEKRTRKREL